MFVNFRRIHKCQCVQLLTTGLLLCVLMVCWEPLDHHVVSHMRSYTYRQLVNKYVFINSSFPATQQHRHHDDDKDPEVVEYGGGSTDYPYLINHLDKCDQDGGGSGGDDVLLLLFVKSSPENFVRRQAIRGTWGNETLARQQLGESVRVLFALGTPPDAADPHRARAAQRDLLAEDRTHGDLIQRDFADTFHNLTAKLILQVHWCRHHCPQARFLMTADDDVFVHVPNLLRYLRGLLDAGAAADVWVGHVHRGAPPVRRTASKYYVSRELYPWPSYPDYTAGAGYVVSGDVAAKIYGAMLALNSSMYIDDVFMGMCANVVGVAPRDHAYFSGEGKAPCHPCIFDRMITSHDHAADMHALWRATTNRWQDPRAGAGLLGDLYCTVVRAMLLFRSYFQKTYSCVADFT